MSQQQGRRVSRVGEVAGATLTVPHLQTAIEAYEGFLGYRCQLREAIREDLAQFWGCPGMTGRPAAWLVPESGAQVPLRMVENPEALDGYRPLRTYGWAALEITVRDTDSLAARLAESPFEVIGPPKELDFTDCFYPMQVLGPAQEVLYLNEVRGDLPDFDLPRAQSFVDHLFIVVLAAPGLEASLSFYEQVLGYQRGAQFEIPYSMINRAFGLPETQKHCLGMTCHGRQVNVEVDQYPDAAESRPQLEGFLPPGIATVTLAVESLERARAHLVGPIQARPEAPFHGRRGAVCRGAAGELIELLEVGSREEKSTR